MEYQRTDNAPSTDAPARPRPSTPPIRTTRKLVKNGNSITVAVPGMFQRALSLCEGDRVELVLDREWGGYFVRALPRPAAPPAAPAAPDRLSEVA